MTANCHAFRVGDISCWALLDGASVIGAEGMMRRFPSVPEAEMRRAYVELGLTLDDADNAMNMLLIRLGADLLLVDTGEGHPKGGALVESLRMAGFAPSDVTRVIITHAHGDHVLGLLTDDGQPTYPNATYRIAAAELPYWQARIEAGAGEQRAIVDMMQARGLQTIDMDAAIMPGVRAVPLPGHTPGHIGLMIESQGETFMHMADLLHSPMQFARPEWSPRFDADPVTAVDTRRAALGRAADAGALTLFYHLTFPGLGRVVRMGDTFLWQPRTEDGA